MKTRLGDYMNKPLSELYAEIGAFYAMSNATFKEKDLNPNDYSRMPCGFYVPKGKEEEFYNRKLAIITKANSDHLAAEGEEAIVMNALWNHECALSQCIEAAVHSVSCYGITEQAVLDAYPAYYKAFHALNS